MLNHKKLLLIVLIAISLILSIALYLCRPIAYVKDEITYVQDSVCGRNDVSMDLMYIPYSVSTRIPVSIEQFQTIYTQKIHINAEERPVIEDACESLKKLKPTMKLDSSFNTRWGLIGYSDKANKLFALYGDGKGHCSIKDMFFSCSSSMDTWVQNLFLAEKVGTSVVIGDKSR